MDPTEECRVSPPKPVMLTLLLMSFVCKETVFVTYLSHAIYSATSLINIIEFNI